MQQAHFKKNPLQRKRHVLDASEFSLGRLASRISILLRGKNKTSYEPNKDVGDFVCISNASKIRLSGKKINYKKYYHHTKFPGGIKTVLTKDLMKNNPENVIKRAVLHMVPKNRLRKNILKRLTFKA